ncbi:MAG: glycosyl transferase [Burkholderiaceae bacterium]|nr:glycosyl transferase [Burkholderiaceae bacterium]
MNSSIVSAHRFGDAPAAPSGPVTVSVVSHGHLAMVQRLLGQLAQGHEGAIRCVVVTHNLPGPGLQTPAGGWPFALVELHNPSPAGFGANHNQAFAYCEGAYFCVINPDIEWSVEGAWALLLAHACGPGVGCVYPVLLNGDGSAQDNQREVPTPAGLFRRHVLAQPQRRVDWASAAFWLLSAQAFRELGGFDARYFMYCEDTDYCLRLQLSGWRLQRAELRLVHHAQRNSRRDLAHLGWHVRSLLRLWFSPVLRQYLARRP